MKVIIDTNILICMMLDVEPQGLWINPRDNTKVDNVHLRAKALKDYIEQIGGVIIVPTPVLAEYLVGIDKEKHIDHVNLISSMSCFELVSFDEIAAIECAKLPTLQEIRQLASSAENTSSKIKFDRQIISIAKANNVNEVWSHDKNVFKKCTDLGISIKSLADIAPPPEQFPLYPDDETGTHITH